MPKNIKIGLIGGNYGLKYIYPAVKNFSTVEFVGLGTRFNEKQKTQTSGTQMLRSIPTFDTDQLINRKLCDLLIIATPPAEQIQICLQALKQGLSVYCEKPVGINHLQTSIIQKYLNSKKTKFFVGYQFRFDPGILWLKKQIESEIIGEIIEVVIDWETSGALSEKEELTWRNFISQGGGVSRDFCCHIFDYLCYLSPNHFNFVPTFKIFKTNSRKCAYLAFQEIKFLAKYNNVKVKIKLSRLKNKKMHHSIIIKGTLGELRMSQFAPFKLSNIRVYFKKYHFQKYFKESTDSIYPKVAEVADCTDLRSLALSKQFSEIFANLRGETVYKNFADISNAYYAQKCVDRLNEKLYSNNYLN